MTKPVLVAILALALCVACDRAPDRAGGDQVVATTARGGPAVPGLAPVGALAGGALADTAASREMRDSLAAYEKRRAVRR
jgi:hypothetical protein